MPTWAYSYEIVPPQTRDRLQLIDTILAEERANAERAARSWNGRFIIEEQVTHILVVSDSPDQESEINRRIEAELTALQAGFSITAPMSIAGDDPAEWPDA